jgi:transcription elongation factor GreA
MEKVPMLAEGYEQLTAELKVLRAERPLIVDAIEEARAHGDLSENAEYHAAKERQGHVETQIADLEDKITRAQIIDLRGNGHVARRERQACALPDRGPD